MDAGCSCTCDASPVHGRRGRLGHRPGFSCGTKTLPTPKVSLTSVPLHVVPRAKRLNELLDCDSAPSMACLASVSPTRPAGTPTAHMFTVSRSTWIAAFSLLPGGMPRNPEPFLAAAACSHEPANYCADALRHRQRIRTACCFRPGYKDAVDGCGSVSVFLFLISFSHQA